MALAKSFMRALPKHIETLTAASRHVDFTLLTALHCILQNDTSANRAMQLLRVAHNVASIALDAYIVRATAHIKRANGIKIEMLQR